MMISEALPAPRERQPRIISPGAHHFENNMGLVRPAECAHQHIVVLVLDYGQDASRAAEFPPKLLILTLPADPPDKTSVYLENGNNIHVIARLRRPDSLNFPRVGGSRLLGGNRAPGFWRSPLSALRGSGPATCCCAASSCLSNCALTGRPWALLPSKA